MIRFKWYCHHLKALVILASAVSLFGCASNIRLPGPHPNDPHYAAVAPKDLVPPPSNNGSIYQEGYNISLYKDRTASRTGDILTIVLTEKTDASKKATTTTKKDNATAVENPTVLGSAVQFNAHKWIPLQSNKNNNLQFKLDATRSFKGEGDSGQSNNLQGSISVTVARVLPNGYLYVRGEKWLTLNQGDEFIRLTGIVRPDDIKPNNTILSTQVADARITYSGRGQVAEVNKVGWLARFFNGALFGLWPY